MKRWTTLLFIVALLLPSFCAADSYPVTLTFSLVGDETYLGSIDIPGLSISSVLDRNNGGFDQFCGAGIPCSMSIDTGFNSDADWSFGGQTVHNGSFSIGVHANTSVFTVNCTDPGGCTSPGTVPLIWSGALTLFDGAQAAFNFMMDGSGTVSLGQPEQWCCDFPVEFRDAGLSLSGTATLPTPIPEPTTVVLFGTGLMLVGDVIRRTLSS